MHFSCDLYKLARYNVLCFMYTGSKGLSLHKKDIRSVISLVSQLSAFLIDY